MGTDAQTMFAWGIFLLAAVGTSAHLYRHLGVLVASQASVMNIAALVDVLLLNHGMSQTLSWAVAVLVAGALGIVHLPVLLQTGSALLLVLTAISQIILVELWYALPELTGGSGGILLPGRTAVTSAMIALLLLMGVGLAYFHQSAVIPAKRFDWACLRTIGARAGAFGVPSLRLYAIGFVFYGTVLGAAGIAATRVLGYMTISSIGLAWALATVMIVLYWSSSHFLGMLALTLLYSGIRVLLRQSVYASTAWSHVFEMLFPLALLVLVRIRAMRTPPTGETGSRRTV